METDVMQTEKRMPRVMEGAQPFLFEGNDIAGLVLHGFTGTTQSVRYFGHELHRGFGFTVHGPRLTGHGTSPDDMATTGFLDWVSSCEQALHELATEGRPVFIAGLSMGGTLALNLAARFPTMVAGIIPINGPVGIFEPPLAELLMDKSAPARVPGIGSDIKDPSVSELAYAELPVSCAREVFILITATSALLSKVTCPVLAMHSREDHIVPPRNGQRILESVGSDDVRLLWLNHSYHVATLDNDKDLIVQRAGRFIEEISG
jgi:carboxylesterase